MSLKAPRPGAERPRVEQPSPGQTSLGRREFFRAAGVATAALAFMPAGTSCRPADVGEPADAGNSSDGGADAGGLADAGNSSDGGAACSTAQPPNTYHVVTQGGAHGDGVTDDLQAIVDAMGAYKQQGYAGLYFPPGRSFALSDILSVPDDTNLYGPCNAGPSSADLPWLMGRVDFGSRCRFEDLKIGPATAGVCGLHNADGSDGTSFTRCHVRGGGGNLVNYPTVTVGGGNDVSNLAFVNCEFERSLGTQWTGSDSQAPGENTISLYAHKNIVDGVRFEGCHFGVTNGVATGAQRMMIECWTAPGANYWRNLIFKDCIFEPSRATGLD
ncbi:MAG: hypothetical protein IT380_00685, partial [Myxococcales bacterium]|nr:hypothetical protein [Myxococcales bacterium]